MYVWLAAHGVQRLFVAHGVRSAVTGVLSKKQITPLIKAIHPDYFMNDNADVKAINLGCVQSLNELWQTMVALEAQLQRRIGGGKEMMIGAPFKVHYDLTCYVKSMGQAKDDCGSLHRVECYIRPHPKLCLAGQVISIGLVKYYLHNILTQMNNLYQDIGMELQLGEVATAELASSQVRSEEDYFEIADGQLEAVRVELEERVANLSERVYAAVSSGDMLAADSPLAPTATARRLQPRKATDREEEEDVGKQSVYSLRIKRKSCEVKLCLFDAELQTFFRGGNVLVKGVEPPEQIAALRKLRKFMGQYGRLLNFRYDRWQWVVFVLAGGTDAAFLCELRGTRHVVTIPLAFAFKDAAAFIQQSLPESKLTYGFGEKSGQGLKELFG